MTPIASVNFVVYIEKKSSTMADHLAAADAQDDDEMIFVYMGGDQVVPDGVRRARIHKSIKIVRALAFQYREYLISVEFHDGIEIIQGCAFNGCRSLRSVKLLGVKVIKVGAFRNCDALTDVEFGDKLETIEQEAFSCCTSLRSITMPQVKTIGVWAFGHCEQLTDLQSPEGFETLRRRAFISCSRLERIAMPLKDNMIEDSVFDHCYNLTSVNLNGRVDKIVSSLHLERWRNLMKGEINGINQLLPNTYSRQITQVIQQWMSAVISRLNHYKTEHHKLLKEATTLLELALWKANLENKEGDVLEKEGVRTRRQRKRARKEISVTSGASIVIKNVLPFLETK